MRKYYIYSSVVLIAIVCFFSCRKKTLDLDVNYGREYYPIEIGKSITYQVDSIIYDDFTGTVRKSVSYLKDVIDTPSLDINNRSVYHVFRYYKAKPTDNFTFVKNYTVQSIDTRIELVDDNLRYIKLIFPVTYLGNWGGNGYINTNSTADTYSWISYKPYSYKDLGRAYQNDSIYIDNTLTVFHINDLTGDTTATIGSFCEYAYSSEKYGKNIGLVYKEISNLRKDPQVGGGKRKGFKATLQCIAHN